ncbi:hypothetical protein PAMP_019168 [Pampus punctatissimus]
MDVSQNLKDQISELLKPHRVCVVTPIILNHSSQPCWRSANRFVVESTFSYLEICSIDIHSLTQIVLETDRQTLSFRVLHIEDLEAMVSHMTASLKRIFPDSSPGKLLKTVPPELQQRLLTLTSAIEEQLNDQPGPCGGFSDTYAALCDFNEMPFREEIQWGLGNSSSSSVLQPMSVDIQQQLNFLLSRSPSLEELSLEASGLKLDFAIKMAAALQEHTSSTLQSINLSGNPIEDKVLTPCLIWTSVIPIALWTRLLLQGLATNTRLCELELDLSSCELRSAGAQVIQEHISEATAIRSLDISDNSFENDMVTLVLSVGRCHTLHHLALGRNFAMKSRALNDVIHRIAQLIQDEECIQQCLDRNNQRQCDRIELQKAFRTRQSEKLVHGLCRQLEDSLKRLTHCSLQDVQADILAAHEVLHNAREFLKLLPSLHETGRKWGSDGDLVNCILTDAAAVLTDEFTRSIQELAQDLMRCAEGVCPRVVQRSSVCECVLECVSKRSRQTHTFLKSTLMENMGQIINNRLQ